MKKELFLFLCLAGLLGASLSCSRDPEQQLATGDPEYIQVKLGVGGDFSVDTEPLTRGTATNHLYAINVYFDSDKDGSCESHYAYGLFDNTDDMVISLLSGYEYGFDCTAVYNGKSKLYYGQYGGNSFPGYAKPFQTNNSASTRLGNAFTLSSSEYFTGMATGTATLKTSSGTAEDTYWPSIERYRGSAYYTAAKGSDASVTINLTRYVFGFRIILKGVEQGTLSATMKIESPVLERSYSTKTSDFDSGTQLFSLQYLSNSDVEATVSWSFSSSRFGGWNLSGSQKITFRRNVLTTATVEVTPDQADGVVNMSEEPLGEDNEINMQINGDGIIEVVVDPVPEP